MPISETLIRILRCPACVHHNNNLTSNDPGQLHLVNQETWFVCQEEGCGRKYPIRQGIPVMLIDEGDKWRHTEPPHLPHPDTLPE
jgi:uncharacterized protein YbaR (Trm112 family)